MNEVPTDVKKCLRIGQLVKLFLRASAAISANDEVLVYSSRIEDLLPEYLVVAWPSDRGVQVPVAVGQSVSVQIVAGQGILRLDSRINAKFYEPLPLLHIASAGDWSKSQMRLNVRLELMIVPHETLLISRKTEGVEQESAGRAPGSTNSQQKLQLSGQPINVIIRDLSAGGVRFACATQLDSGDLVKVRFPLGKGQPDITALAKVVWTAEDGTAKRHRYVAGCQFLDLGTREQDNIAKFIFAKQVELRRSGLA
ncbi:MAG: flagellar brake protein [Dehalococcoidales bacterium]|nr:flagellar brake protein [Dehalococcoidales bacterium]